MAAITDAFAVVAALVGEHGCCDLGLLLDIKKGLAGPSLGKFASKFHPANQFVFSSLPVTPRLKLSSWYSSKPVALIYMSPHVDQVLRKAAE